MGSEFRRVVMECSLFGEKRSGLEDTTDKQGNEYKSSAGRRDCQIATYSRRWGRKRQILGFLST